jgi:purine-nucleoside phosphorylase
MKEQLEIARRAAELLPGPDPEIALILGSGLGDFVDKLENAVAVSTTEIEGYPPSTVPGHSGRIVLGRLEGKSVLAFQGRIHYYEGYHPRQVVLPVLIARERGARKLVVTNAAGGINRYFRPGDLMLITDHINLMGMNPLLGPNDETLGPRFPDMSAPYDPDWIRTVEKLGLELRIPLHRGVLMGLSGPSYETPAEIRMMQRVGADAACMSTIPEVIMANYLGLRVLGISLITNLASGLGSSTLDHEEVTETAGRAAAKFAALLSAVIKRS